MLRKGVNRKALPYVETDGPLQTLLIHHFLTCDPKIPTDVYFLTMSIFYILYRGFIFKKFSLC